MGASIEWLCAEHGILRAGPDHVSHARRDPYAFACTVIRQGDTALLCGATDAARAQPHRQEIAARLRAEGFRAVAWERAGLAPIRFALR